MMIPNLAEYYVISRTFRYDLDDIYKLWYRTCLVDGKKLGVESVGGIDMSTEMPVVTR
jgi:hypothetical protein